jgi:hypothetical protein
MAGEKRNNVSAAIMKMASMAKIMAISAENNTIIM